jgi:hypothetical protein
MIKTEKRNSSIRHAGSGHRQCAICPLRYASRASTCTLKNGMARTSGLHGPGRARPGTRRAQFRRITRLEIDVGFHLQVKRHQTRVGFCCPKPRLKNKYCGWKGRDSLHLFVHYCLTVWENASINNYIIREHLKHISNNQSLIAIMKPNCWRFYTNNAHA